MPDGLSAQTALADQLKRKKLFDAMAASINKPETQPMAGGVNLPVGNAPIEPMPSGLPSYPEQAKQQPPPIRIHLGTDTKGLQGVDKSIAELRTQQQAAKDYPSSKVVDGRILPPKMHHGIGDKLKSIGKGILINMGEYARTHPGAETGELLGAGGAGGIVGGISPVSIDALQRQGEIRQKQGEVGSQIGLEQEAAQTAAMKQKPINDAERIALESQRTADAARREDEKMRETAEYHRATIEERKNRPRASRQPDTLEDDKGNKYLADPDSGEPLRNKDGSIRYTSRSKPERSENGTPPEVIDRNIAAIRVQQAKIDQFLNNPTNQHITEPGGKYEDGTLAADTKKPNPEWKQAKADRNRLDTEIRDWEGKRKTAPATASTKPAKDGKFHYTPDQIRAKAEADGVSYDQLLNILKKKPNVVIE